MCSMCTTAEITMKEASRKVSDVSERLPPSTDEQRRTQHTHSAVVEAGLLMRLRQKSDYEPGALAQGIGVKARTRYWNGRGERGGQG